MAETADRTMNKRVLVVLSPWDVLQPFLVEELRATYGGQVTALLGVRCDERVASRLCLRVGGWLHMERLVISAELQACDLADYDAIIVNETLCASVLMQYLLRRTKHAQVVYVLWNTIDRIHCRLYNFRADFLHVVAMQDTGRVQVVSFDAGDCRRYGLWFNGQVVPYFGGTSVDEDTEECFFCGADKGRLPILQMLAQELQRQGLTYRFLLAPSRHQRYSKAERAWLTLHEHMPYDALVRETRRHRCIVDIVQAEQRGLTWRPIEALFYHKKLITNFAGIRDYDFYRPENVFVLGEDNNGTLAEFVRAPYQTVPAQLVQQYRITGWLERLVKGENMEEIMTIASTRGADVTWHCLIYVCYTHEQPACEGQVAAA